MAANATSTVQCSTGYVMFNVSLYKRTLCHAINYAHRCVSPRLYLHSLLLYMKKTVHEVRVRGWIKGGVPRRHQQQVRRIIVRVKQAPATAN